MSVWPSSSAHHRWLDQHSRELLAFGRRTADPGGGARWLGERGEPMPGRPVSVLISSRMTHVYGIGALLGVPGAGRIAARAMAGLTGRLRDPRGGWFPAVAADGTPEPGKSCYDHAFVLLAASTAVQAGLDGADRLLSEAAEVLLSRFWDEEIGLCADTWDTGFTALDDYRGINANMHAVEAMLSAASVTGDHAWVARALRICRFVVTVAEAHRWRIPEHYDAAWQPLPEYHREEPEHPFKPYGATIGHGLEWARLLLHAASAPTAGAPAWLTTAARELFARAVTDGWAVDGRPGFVYTTDWTGRPVVRDRMHWVAAEAVHAAAALHAHTGEAAYAQWYRTWWDYIDEFLIDHEHGSWFHQLDPENAPTATVWPGKADLYHAFQATLGPRVPLWPMLATAVDRHLA
ncbi:AGE family epimerase/isomerase [Couchioplanes caeruleus]|uniref:N-acyl-D-glucosamine 2-epimerase n=2 Tax=Couchioplanes caeruleus TaxID=56438 RepID=A0A1K0G1L5_9ACTN|nr:AGE family epimerase/isomerase [Couchioplanes caeruleus]OJF11202.1 N-acyl-D-glucosamine 2-epimerase [Couchioplanes caeruleus subsp. caeruleus]OJF15994.1 N-acyl-D-glucosamine 2-epimerase [Couchioplanes caeruleus subsp. caeruleus]ROP27851.1 mannose/cellobiose epimerase-like protein (N-acyl-D-glucosamine 2-epimerase family) [Couchioplanes caeruleus]